MRTGVVLLVTVGAILAGLLSVVSVPAHSREDPRKRLASAVTGRSEPARHVRVMAVHADGSPAAGALVQLYQFGVNWSDQADPRETDDAGCVEFDASAAGLHRVVLKHTPEIHAGWLYRGNPAHFVDFEIGAAERFGHDVRLVVPRGGELHVVVDRRDLPEDAHIRVGLRRFFPSGDLRHSHSVPKPAPPILDESGRMATYRFPKLPAVRFEVRVFGRHGAVTVTEVDVLPGKQPTILKTAVGHPCDPVRFLYGGRPPPEGEGKRHTLQVNPFDRARPDVGHGRFNENPGSVRLTNLRPGRYMTALCRADLAMFTEIPEAAGDETVIRLQPPDDLWPIEGGQTVKVRVKRGTERLIGAMIALAPARDRQFVHGNWFRVTNAGDTTFTGVPPGEYDVLLIDGLWGEYFGVRDSPLQRRIRVYDKGVEVEFRLGPA